jgi:hypothetical protein
MRRDLPEIRYMLERLPGVARKVLERLDAEPGSAPPPPHEIQAGLQRARQRYWLYTGTVAAAAAGWALAQQLGPPWFGWALGLLAAGLLFAGRPRA